MSPTTEPETIEPDDAEEWHFDHTECPLCGWPGTMIGKMHRRLFLRCGNCGLNYNREV